MLNWYCFPVIRHRENTATAYLQSLALQTLNPRTVQKITPEHGKPYNIYPQLFPGYIFAECKLSDWHLRIQRAPGIRKPVRFTDEPYSVPFDVIEEIQSRQDVDGLVRLGPDAGEIVNYQPGDHIRVASGLWKNFEGLFQLDADGRVMCLLRAINDARLEPTPVYRKVWLNRDEITLAV